MDLLRDLYFGTYMGELQTDLPEALATMKKLDPYYERIQSTFGPDFLDEMMEVETELSTIESFCAFRQGIRLGGQMVLEVLSQEDSI